MNLQRLFLPLLLTACLFGACLRPVERTGRNDPPPQPDQPLTYLALGDSYTIGESVSEAQRWPVQLAAQLRTQGIRIDPPRIVARTGWTTNELQNAIAAAAIRDTFSLVSLLIGVNNQYRGYPIAQYRREFAQLLDTAVGFAGGRPQRVFVLSIPDYGATPFGQSRNPAKIAEELDRYNAIADSICQTRSISFFNITPISREATGDPELVAPDRLHPSGKMYARWVELILPDILLKALKIR
ncbi:MAG: SGNH/GDSL hydrolase family protein [Bacteroidia bacterium]|nr:SGNH/GDSL hydrolase family protein [Bacteroidia bacterium]